jgi:hypothetical protein
LKSSVLRRPGNAPTARADYFRCPETTRLCRPLRRRRFKTLRPLAVLMRFLKPCFRNLLRFFGCHVRFTVQCSACPNLRPHIICAGSGVPRFRHL